MATRSWTPMTLKKELVNFLNGRTVGLNENSTVKELMAWIDSAIVQHATGGSEMVAMQAALPETTE